MAGLLNLARAARLVGVPRGHLQRMIASGELPSFDGLVALDDLQRAFPQAELASSGALEKVAQIRDQAFGRRVMEFVLPSQQVLAQRLFAVSVELADVRRHLQAYHELLTAARSRIESLAAGEPFRRSLLEFLDSGLQRILASQAAPLEAEVSMLEAVTAHVTVRPSGHQFLVEGNDSILQAGLKAGVQFGYGCGTGTCGLCKARVVAGQVRPLFKGDHRLTDQEIQHGYALLCTHTAVSDLIVETLEAAGPQDIAHQDIVARVRAVAPLAPDTLLLHVQTPRTHRLRFLAGQSVTLGVAGGGDDLFESAPIASCPCDERNLHFHFARQSGGALGAALFAGRLRAGDAIDVHGPAGDFILDGSRERAPVFIACDTGFAPIKSLIEHAISIDAFESIALYWVATRSDGHYLANQCRAWAASLDHFTYRASTDADAAAGAQAVAAAVVGQRTDLTRCAIYVAGPPIFVEHVNGALAAAGVRAGQIASLAQ
jgi:CDP-4-dehydro-6-deoxyglucose reductase, E3